MFTHGCHTLGSCRLNFIATLPCKNLGSSLTGNSKFQDHHATCAISELIKAGLVTFRVRRVRFTRPQWPGQVKLSRIANVLLGHMVQIMDPFVHCAKQASTAWIINKAHAPTAPPTRIWILVARFSELACKRVAILTAQVLQEARPRQLACANPATDCT